MILSSLLEAAVRSAALGIVLWLVLRLLRSRRPQAISLIWSFALLAALFMPLLVLAMKVIFESVPKAVSWIPPAPSAIFLRPLVPVEPEVFLLPDVSKVLIAAYAVVAGIELLRLSVGLIRGVLLRFRSIPLEEAWAAGWDVRASDRVTVPVTFGRTILLPEDASEWSETKRQAILGHEQAHVRRWDFYVQMLARIHRAIFWFSPFAWWLKSELVRVAENTCDDEALRQVDDRISYAEILVEMAGRGAKEGLVGVSMARGTTVTKRVERILKETEVRPRISWGLRLLMLTGIFPLVVLSAGMQARVEKKSAGLISVGVSSSAGAGSFTWQFHALPPIRETSRLSRLQAAAQAQTPTPTPQRETRTQTANPLERWIDQEVPDISTEAERTAFRNIKSDEEREQFIREFWLRRDPTPGTADNEYRNEYNVRIAAANKYFTTGAIEGYLTDRGRIYLKFGPPDEIETHAQGETYRRPAEEGGGEISTFPFDKWRYRVIEGIGRNVILEFVDIDRSGNYRLTFDPSERDKLLGAPR